MAVLFPFEHSIYTYIEHSEYSCNWKCSVDDPTAQWLIGGMCQSPNRISCQDGGVTPEDLKS